MSHFLMLGFLFSLSPSISMQNEEVSAVIAPSALGNKAEIKPIMKMIPMASAHNLMRCGKQVITYMDVDTPFFCSNTGIAIHQEIKKQKINKHNDNTKCDHILLRIFQCSHTDIFLHHFLVKPGHCYCYKCTTNNLFKKKPGLFTSVLNILV